MNSTTHPTSNVDSFGLKPRLHRPFSRLVMWVAICFGAAAIGAFFPPDEWFQTLQKPALQPPNWLFGPVWTVLYALMGTSMWLVSTNLRSPRRLREKARHAFIAQLVLNSLWTPVFFGAHAITLALVLLIVIIAAVTLTAKRFYDVDPRAAWMLIPYIAWLCIATALNASIVWLN